MVYMFKSIAMGYIAVTMSVTGFGPLSVSCWIVDIYSFKFVQQTSFTLLMWSRWNLINLWHDKFTVMYSNEPKKNYPCSSIDRTLDLQAGGMGSITAMGKWLLVCLQMAIAAWPTHVWNGLASCDVAICLRNSRTNFIRACVARWVHCDV